MPVNSERLVIPDRGVLVPWKRDGLCKSRSAAPGSQGATRLRQGYGEVSPKFIWMHVNEGGRPRYSALFEGGATPRAGMPAPGILIHHASRD